MFTPQSNNTRMSEEDRHLESGSAPTPVHSGSVHGYTTLLQYGVGQSLQSPRVPGQAHCNAGKNGESIYRSPFVGWLEPIDYDPKLYPF
ncbi:hypothetical protein VTG60DRAFT_5368 [Thermothelomyces hinnuleus]